MWSNVGLGVLVAALLIYRWPDVRWLDVLLLALPLLNLANIAISRRAHPTTTRLLYYEQESLQRGRDISPEKMKRADCVVVSTPLTPLVDRFVEATAPVLVTMDGQPARAEQLRRPRSCEAGAPG